MTKSASITLQLKIKECITNSKETCTAKLSDVGKWSAWHRWSACRTCMDTLRHCETVTTLLLSIPCIRNRYPLREVNLLCWSSNSEARCNGTQVSCGKVQAASFWQRCNKANNSCKPSCRGWFLKLRLKTLNRLDSVWLTSSKHHSSFKSTSNLNRFNKSTWVPANALFWTNWGKEK